MTPTASSPPIRAAPEARLVTAYVPRLLIQRLAERPDASVEEVDGTIAFVDISGFTRLSERLATKGRVGAEELTEAIESCFTALLALAYENGGSLIKFGGDALLLFFTGEDHGLRACRTAVWMRRALREIGKLETSGGKVNLRMSVGIHSGSFHFFLVGGSHREFMIAGPAASRTVSMEHAADAGEIVVSHATAALLPEHVLGPDRGAGRLLRRAPEGPIAPGVQSELTADPAQLLACIPLAIRGHLLAGVQEPEHRRATVAFLRFDGTDELIRAQGGGAVAEALDELIRDVQREVDAQEICFLGTDVDEDGGKIILTAGVPSGTGNDEERMLLALRAIATGPRTLPLRIGVHRGPVFAGDIGPPYRRTYTIMGDTVNLAARLMANATPGELLATREVLHHSNTCFSIQALEPFPVKGKSLLVQAYAVGDAAGTRARVETVRVPLKGRGFEMAALRTALAEAREGEGRLVEIIGEPGIGKSRLVAELESKAGDLLLLSIKCELYRSSTPYSPFRRLLERVLGVDEGTDDARAMERLTTIVASSAPTLLPWLPLLGIPLDLRATETPETKALDERFRRGRLEEVVGELLRALLPAPTLIVIEDAHWMDEPSADLLRHLTTTLPGMPWLICVTRRAEGAGFHAPEDARGITMRPAPLDEADCLALLESLTQDHPLSPHQTLALARRSGGNPLLARELLSAMQAAGSIDGLPDSVESLMTSRIDRLTVPDRMLLRRAAVLGTSFSPQLLGELLDGHTPPPSEDDWHRLAEFVELRPDGTVAFRRSLIRDAAYEGLPFRLRRDLHARAGESIERSVSDAAEEAELLSLHFFHARRLEPAWRFSRLAGHRARAKYAPVEAAEFYQRAVEAARGLSDVPRTTSPTCTRRSATSATGRAPSGRRATPIAPPVASSRATPCGRRSSC
jgi:class 3 adenylate cyclase